MQVEIQNLCVKVDEKDILKDLNLKIEPGTIHAIMGPNGVGKSTLSKVIMGYPGYQIAGEIIANNRVINNLSIDERSRLGIFLVYQNPISIDGITNRELIKASLDSQENEKLGLYEFVKELDKNVLTLQMNKDMPHRNFNVGFSGGERKKNEILQVLMLKPKFIILDELDSGLDVDSLKVVTEVLNQYLKDNPDTSVLIITHYTRILDYLKPDYVHMMKCGHIVKSGDYSLAFSIEKYGYQESFNTGRTEEYE